MVNEKNRGRTGWYDIADTITNDTDNDPNDFNAAAYDVHKIRNEIGINAPILYVINDAEAQGTGILYCIVSHGGGAEGSHETPIYAHERKMYKDVSEIKLRSPTQNLAYRISEYEIQKQ